MELVRNLNLKEIKTNQSDLAQSIVENYISLGAEEILAQVAQHQREGRPFLDFYNGETYLTELNHRCRALYELGVLGIILDSPVPKVSNSCGTKKLIPLREAPLLSDEYYQEWCTRMIKEVANTNLDIFKC